MVIIYCGYIYIYIIIYIGSGKKFVAFLPIDGANNSGNTDRSDTI